jgi:hypothetical protein
MEPGDFCGEVIYINYDAVPAARFGPRPSGIGCAAPPGPNGVLSISSKLPRESIAKLGLA